MAVLLGLAICTNDHAGWGNDMKLHRNKRSASLGLSGVGSRLFGLSGATALCTILAGLPAVDSASAQSPLASSGQIVIGHSTQCVDLPNGEQGENIPINQYPCDGSTEQGFAVVAAANGYYNIKSSRSGKCLTILNSSMADNDPLVQNSCNGSASQSFSLTAVGNDFYNIAASHSGKCLSVPNGSVDANIGLVQLQCNGTKAQMFWFQDLVGMVLPPRPVPVQQRTQIQQPPVQQPQWQPTPAPQPQWQRPQVQQPPVQQPQWQQPQVQQPAPPSGTISRLSNKMTFIAETQTISLSPDGQRMVSGGWDNKLTIWDTSGSAPVGVVSVSLQGRGDLLLDTAFSPDSRRIVTGSRQSGNVAQATVNVWDASTGAVALVLQNPPSAFCGSVAYDPQGSRIAAACFNQTTGARTLQLWDANSGAQLLFINGVNGSVVFSPDGSRVASDNGSTQAVNLYDTRNGQLVQTIQANIVGGAKQVIFSPDGVHLITGNGEGTISAWNIATAQQVFKFSGYTSSVNDVVINKAGTRLASVHEDGSLVLWDGNSGQQLSNFKSAKSLRSVSFSPDGDVIVSGGDENIIRVFAD